MFHTESFALSHVKQLKFGRAGVLSAAIEMSQPQRGNPATVLMLKEHLEKGKNRQLSIDNSVRAVEQS